MRQILVPAAIAAVVIGVAAFAFFLADVVRLEGDALSGRVADGRWFVSDHGRETEVSQADWEKNRALGIVMFVAFPAAMVGGFYLLIAVLIPRMMFGAPAEEREARVREVAGSGPVVASGTTAASIGLVNLGLGMLRVNVHPGGVVLRARLIGSAALRASEIRSVRETAGWLTRRVVVEHGSAHVKSPVLLHRRIDPALTEALKKLAPG